MSLSINTTQCIIMMFMVDNYIQNLIKMKIDQDSHILACGDNLASEVWDVSAQFQLSNEEGSSAISANKSPGNVKLISIQIFAHRCCQEE